MINDRPAKIIQLLLDQDTPITISKIADFLNVSSKTIRNDLWSVEKLLEGSDVKLLKKTGVGISLEGTQTQKLHLREQLPQASHPTSSSPEGRLPYIGIKVILNSNYRVYKLANELFISRATIHNDLQSLEPVFASYKIKMIRKNNNGIRIQGSEKNCRKLLMDLLSHDSGFLRFADQVRNPNRKCDGTKLFIATNYTDENLAEFLKVLSMSNSAFLQSLTQESLTHIILRIIVVLLRIRTNHFIHLSDEFIAELQAKRYFDDARHICDSIQSHYRISIPDIEARYLQVFFLSAQKSDSKEADNRKEAEYLADLLISDWGNELKLGSLDDPQLRKATITHLESAITRFRHGISYENSLMKDIYRNYPNTLRIVRHSMKYIEDRYSCNISDDEVGFFTLHLASAMERLKEPLNTLLVSIEGPAATELLRSKIQSNFHEINLLKTQTNTRLNVAASAQYDLILSTTHLNCGNVPVIVINPVLYPSDIVKLKKIVLTYYNHKNDPLLRK